MENTVPAAGAAPVTSTPEAASQPPQAQPQQKFLGKYTSMEEAERGYKELERFAYDQSRQAAESRRQVELLASQAQFPNSAYGYAPQGTVPGYPGFVDPRAEAEVQAFYANPLDYMKRREAEVEKRAYERVTREMRAELLTRDTLGQWKSENPDLLRHEPLVATFVAQQPAHLSVREKLDRAAEEARRYLAAEITRSGQARQAPNPNDIVESPASGAASSQASPAQDIPSEGALADYIKERRRDITPRKERLA